MHLEAFRGLIVAGYGGRERHFELLPGKQAQDDYQVHPLHVEFVEKVFKRIGSKVVIHDSA